jgi:hypothetical protein
VGETQAAHVSGHKCCAPRFVSSHPSSEPPKGTKTTAACYAFCA